MSFDLEKELFLIEAAKNGDERAFALLIKPYEARVFALLLRYSGNPSDAEDLFQEVFLRVWKSLEGFELRSTFSTWLTKIAINAALSFTSKKQSTDRFINQSIEVNENENAEIQNAALGYDSSLVSEHSTLTEILEGALKKLSPQMRSTLLLKYQDGYKVKEIAEMMNCSEGTVKRYLFDATARIKEDLKTKKVIR